MTNTTANTKKFNAKTATKPEFDREIRRIASAKCIAGQEIKALKAKKKPVPEELQSKYDKIIAEYDRVRKAKAKKFPGRKTYMDMTASEIKGLDLKTCTAGIASLHSKKSRYPEQTDAVMKQMNLFMARKHELTHAAEVKATLKGMSKEEIEAILANK